MHGAGGGSRRTTCGQGHARVSSRMCRRVVYLALSRGAKDCRKVPGRYAQGSPARFTRRGRRRLCPPLEFDSPRAVRGIRQKGEPWETARTTRRRMPAQNRSEGGSPPGCPASCSWRRRCSEPSPRARCPQRRSPPRPSAATWRSSTPATPGSRTRRSGPQDLARMPPGRSAWSRASTGRAATRSCRTPWARRSASGSA